MELKRFQDAIADFEAVVAIKPDVSEAHYYMGMIYKYEIKNPQSAKEHLQRILDLKPKDKELVAEVEKELKDLQDTPCLYMQTDISRYALRW